MPLARLLAAFAVILSVSACSAVPDPAPEAAPPPASAKSDEGPATENNPL